MAPEQRDRMIHRYVAKWRDAPTDSWEERLYKNIVLMLGYAGSVRTINARSRELREQFGSAK